MAKSLYIYILLIFVSNAYTQDRSIPNDKELDGSFKIRDSLSLVSKKSTSIKNLKNPKAKIQDYLIISHKNDTTYVDTTLTIEKEYLLANLRCLKHFF